MHDFTKPGQLLAALLLALTIQASAYGDNPPATDIDSRIVTAERAGYTIAGLMENQRGISDFQHGVALFPGHPGILKLREESGQPAFDLKGNFLVRSRDQWLDGETLVLVIDAPSDVWGTFSQSFRETPRYGADIAALIAEAGKRYKVRQWTFVGTSEGSISAYHAARMNPDLAKRLILTASVFSWGSNGPGLSGVSFADLKTPLLWVHHADDPCRLTQYSDAQSFAQKSSSPLLTVRGGEGARGAACAAFTAHGFVGIEKETVAGMRQWIRTGEAPVEIAK